VIQQAYNVVMCCKLAHTLLLASFGLFLSIPSPANQSVATTVPVLQRVSSCPVDDAASRPTGLQSTIAELYFDGQLQIPVADQEQVASTLQQQTYSGDLDAVASELQKRVTIAWQERGYFKARVQANAKVLTSSPVNQRISVTIHVDAGQQYRLGDITFINNRAVSNVQALRNLFPIKQGDVFDIAKIRAGVEKLRFAYAELGYINATFVPDTRIDEEHQRISVNIDMDEGKSFIISSIEIIGLDENTLQSIYKGLYFKRGDVYNQRLAGLFMQEHASLLPSNVSPDSRIRFNSDNELATVGLTFDFRDCPVD
jgi:outer membrane translocation and assembly module TamA